MDEERPDPEALLFEVQREEKKSKGGRLKIFFGMSAGVGKTYAMLEDAQRLTKEGVDLVVGVINTHGRVETAELLKGLKIIPQKWITYKDTIFEEFDIDEILRIKPQLVLVDELAHTNVPGSRHPKRWQDVLELLDAGIDVYTTLNVQHVESRKDVVEGITGIQIRETVPDLILERANDIELIDITPDDLLQRLHEGKVYLGDKSITAAENFFKEQFLVALREIALRFTAEKVDHDLHGIYKGWRTRERLMVAVSASPSSQQLIRTARKLAFEVDAPWIAIYVDTGLVLDNKAQALLVANLNLARDLGAEVITITDRDVASGLQRVAQQKNVSQILVGRPDKWRFSDLFKTSLIERLVQNNPNADIVVVRQNLVSGIYFKTLRSKTRGSSSLLSYGIAILSIMISTLLAYILDPWIDYRGVGIVYMLNILLLSFFQWQGPIILGSVISILLWDFLFIPPLLSLKIDHPEDIRMLFLYFTVASAMGVLGSRIKEKERLLTLREESSEFLYEIEKEIATATTIQHLQVGVINQLKKLFKGDFDIIVKSTEDQLVFDSTIPLMKDEKERVVALWTFKNDKIAGWSTDTLPASTGIYFPIRGFGETVGVLAFQPKFPRPFTISEMNLIQTVNQQVGVYIQRSLTKEKARTNEYIREAEKAQDAIFHSFSHNINVPLMHISKLMDELKNEETDKKKQPYLIEQIEKNMNDLKELVRNILTMSKISSGFMHFVKIKQDVKQLIDASLAKIQNVADQQRIQILIEKNVPHIDLDKQLMEIALYNLLVNALEYSPSQSPITIEVYRRDKDLVISVRDEGPGIPEEILPRIFEKFYQAEVPGAETMGLGLGLAVTRAIVEMHQGRLEASNREGGGAEFALILPI